MRKWIILLNSPLQIVETILSKKYGVNLLIKRDDLIHPTISGNKWRKLKYNLQQAKENGCDLIISFGGAYSNHLHALAFAAHDIGIKAHAIIRGEYDPSNPTVASLQNNGMSLQFISRLEYKQRNDVAYLARLQDKFPRAAIIPEGGTNKLAVQGVAEILNELPLDKIDYICVPCGSGGTTAGILGNCPLGTEIISIPVLKKAAYLKDRIEALLTPAQLNNKKWHFIEGYDFGGYGKVKSELLLFIEDFYQQTNIKIEPVYSGKMFFAIFDLISKGYFAPGSTIVLIHTGGMQGLDGMRQRKLVPHGWLED